VNVPQLPEEPPREAWGWTRAQRAALGTLLFLLLVFLVVEVVRRPARLDDPLVVMHGQSVELAAKIDPNTATLEDLSRVPHLGEKLSGAIIAWREARKALVADGVLFHRPEDLAHVPGVGRTLVAQVGPYLSFPEDATEPAEDVTTLPSSPPP
jgi:DNA uptake protein ComE-like DNA-binding protein